jgi:hypothetical protein
MRTCSPQPKELRTLAMPADLREFLVGVDELIGAEDELATTESDDLLQCERAYGGLLDKGGFRYGFTYFPDKGIRHKWEFCLSAYQINAVAAGGLSTLDLWCCTSPDCKSGFEDKAETCFYCDYIEEA